MLELVHGNLLGADVESVVNPVNTVGVMGKGLALQFKRAYPDNYRGYREACRSGELTVGKVFTFDAGASRRPRYVINVPTKEHFRGASTLAIVQAGIDALADEVRRLGVGSVAVPALGCGLGGLAWADVLPRISAALAALPDVRVLVFAPETPPPAPAP